MKKNIRQVVQLYGGNGKPVSISQDELDKRRAAGEKFTSKTSYVKADESRPYPRGGRGTVKAEKVLVQVKEAA